MLIKRQVEVIGQKPLEETENEKETDPATYRLVRAQSSSCCPTFD
jgi:hypothetical protein